MRYTARHVVLANGADPFVPPVPGLRELEGVWTNREATGDEGGAAAAAGARRRPGRGRAGAGGAPARRRGGARRARPSTCCAREPAPLGEALGEVLRREGIELVLGVSATGARRDGEDFVLDAGRRPRAARRPAARRDRPRPRVAGHRPGDGRHRAPTRTASPVDEHLRAAERLWGVGDVTGIWPLTHVGKYQGEVVAANILGEPRRPTTTRCRGWSTPTRRRPRSARPRRRSAAPRR